ncbi:MAG: NTP transferase domain-containing protein [Bacteroidales bacterium]|nr:NTP transferase domain-containing protein [Bacteroidales bacterium]
MRAMIFAAGLGTRLKPITDTMPKALVPVGAQPLLGHLIGKLKKAGYDEVVINVHHFAQMIRDYMAQNGNFGIKVLFSDETDLLRETGGGIRHAAAILNDGEPFLVHNVDILSNLDLETFYEAHMAESISLDTPLATLLVSDRETSRYFLFDTGNNLVGWMNRLSGEVKSPFPELRREPSCDFKWEQFLQEHSLRKYAFAGTHVVSPEVFKLMQEWPERFSIVDFYLQMADKYIIKGYVKDDLRMVDVGKLDSLKEAEEFLNDENV